MITIDQLNIYRKYGGLEDGLARAGRTSEKQLFENNDWGKIADSEQNIELIAKGLTSKEFKIRIIQKLHEDFDSNAYAVITSPISEIFLGMKQQHFKTFFNALIAATEKIEDKYFYLPVAYNQEFVFRERAYCYELYHQIRQILPADFPYILSGEVNKAGHPRIAPFCGSIIPDFLVHNPGQMGEDDNLVIVEVKTIQGADYNREGKNLLKDMNTINCMTNLQNGYFRGIILIFGANNNEKKQEIEDVYRDKCNPEKVLLLFHDNPKTQARLL